ncbi:MAG: RHS repeat-associated core domain-containing protein, partial [Thermoanaerobaculia bacterium]
MKHSVAALLLTLLPVVAAAQAGWTSGPYAYDGAGNIVAIGRVSGPSDTFTYDEFGRIRSAAVAGQTQQFTYDRFGNLRMITSGSTTVTFGVDPNSNQLSRSTDTATGQPVNAWATYDAAGQLKQWQTSGGSFEYDAVGMIRSSAGITGEPDKIYIYTASDERIGTITVVNSAESASEWTLRDMAGKVLRRLERYRDGTEAKWRWRQDYIYFNGRLLASEVDTVGIKTLHFFLDHLGTPRLITGNGGVQVAEHTYQPFGAEVTPANQNTERLKFTGHERDTAGLDYMHARYYSAGVGRFLSVDPVLDVKRASR